MEFLTTLFAKFNPIAQLALFVIQTVQALAPNAINADKKQMAVDTLTKLIAIQAPVQAEVAAVHAAMQSTDPAVVAAGLGHAIESTLSVAKALNLFPKAGIVQNAAPLSGASSS